jgi:hypothetical protein
VLNFIDERNMKKSNKNRGIALFFCRIGCSTSLCITAFLMHQSAIAQSPSPPTKFLIGKELESKLASAGSITYANARLREEVLKFSRHEGVGIFIDRRIDPGREFSLQLSGVTVEQILWRIAEQTQLGVCRIGDIFYLGPKEAAEILPVLWQKMKADSKKMQFRCRVKWTQNLKLDWPVLSQPDELLSGLAQDHQFTIGSLDARGGNEAELRLPHDLWPRIVLPDCALDEQVALLLVGFNLWFERSEDGTAISVVPYPQLASGQLERRLGKNGKEILGGLTREFPQCQLTLRGQVLTLSGPINELAAIESKLVFLRKPPQGLEERYTLVTHATREQILATIAQKTGRVLEFDSEFRRTMEERIELDVKNLSRDELVAEALRGTSLRFEFHPQNLRVFR